MPRKTKPIVEVAADTLPKATPVKVVFEGKYKLQRKRIFDRLLSAYDETHHSDPVFVELVKVYATVQETHDRLQAYIDLHGMTYEKTQVNGNVQDVARPELVELNKLRTSILDMARKMQRYTQQHDGKKDSDLDLLK
jgi:hypothetical protein